MNIAGGSREGMQRLWRRLAHDTPVSHLNYSSNRIHCIAPARELPSIVQALNFKAHPACGQHLVHIPAADDFLEAVATKAKTKYDCLIGTSAIF